MKVSDKLALIDKVGRELQARFRYDEIDVFLAEYKIKPPTGNVGINSKWVYSKAALQGVDTSILIKIAQELEVPVPHSQHSSAAPPRNWIDTTDFRLFISHISKDKDKAIRLKDCLAPFAISGFVAHEDILPTLEWQSEIERALYSMDAFIAIHTEGFSASCWTQQEIGFAVGRGAKIISFKMGEDPTGFISKHQALARRQRTAEQIAQEIDSILSADEQSAARLLEAKKARGLRSSKASALIDDIPF
jgi:TIR domain